MPRTRRGGQRTGTPGKAYPNRTDLREAKILPYTGGTYGNRVRQEEAQRATPEAPAPPSAAGVTPAAPLAPAGPPPGGLGNLTDPTARPDEPITAGLASGAGPGPEVLSAVGNPDIDMLRALQRAHPTAGLRAIIAAMEEGA